METPIWLAECSDRLRRAYAYWHSKCDRCHMPSRADLDPVEIPDLLPHVTLVDVVPDDRRFVYRLVGTSEVDVRGRDPTGLSVAEAYFGPTPESAVQNYVTVAETKRPVFERTDFTSANGRFVDEEALFLPLSSDGIAVDMIFVVARVKDNFLATN